MSNPNPSQPSPPAHPTLAIESPWGWWQISTCEAQVLSVDFMGAGPDAPARTEPDSKLEKQLHCMLSRYFRGDVVDFKRIPVDYSQVTPFQQQVLTLLRTVPYGETRSYQWIAEALEKPNATRAIGGVMGSNPWPIIVPCHRVISKTGTLGGFMRNREPQGPSIKSGLLALEGVRLSGPSPSSSQLKLEM